jgi:selenide,water dikinase
MVGLNTAGIGLGELNGVTAMTDITGFSLTGHLLEMLGDSELCACLDKKAIPVFSNMQEYTSKFIYPDNTTRILNSVSEKVEGMKDLDFLFYCDPQTSGGLLFTVKTGAEQELLEWQRLNKTPVRRIGKMCKKNSPVMIHFRG